MTKKLLVLGPYPNQNNIKDGLVQRIKKIDKFMANEDRVYLQVSLKKFILPVKEKYGEKVVFYQLNFILGWWFILYHVLTSSKIYSHTIYNLLWIKYFFPFINKKIILDVHGAVPDEKRMEGDIKMADYYETFERKCFEKISTAIFVTEAMEKHYKTKYSDFNFEAINFGIIPENLVGNYEVDNGKETEEIIKKIDLKESDILVIYSGGLHVWQNIDEMLDLITSKINDQNIVYLLLVNDKTNMIKKLNERSINKRIFVDSVLPDKLKYYYNLADYGFVLRDDNVVNRVANPTKLIEYLFYNITPIVKLQAIGDFEKYNYYKINKEEFLNNDLEKNLNQQNKEVVKKIFSTYNENQIKALFI
ncbi:glycosyltransferase family protein [Flavobacterium ginsenosidimutans]|uniref:Glycosyl transferase family 1 domain-containing protein n=1 Tax=Flavobacterium ginsenosidimutans TaxID=687844 RepID=A0ABZ2QBN9_9FLAO|nr:glycosyltransferase family 4 protein [Flavobacterium ginsenosidimutans]KAF2334161.1 glycosyltransferase family 4 protein [Flavobacterium ginsenosidimutans]